MPNNAKISVYKEKEFEMYALWKSMPAYFRGMKKDQLLSLGFSDPMIQKVVKIKSQTEFAKAFHIKDLGTLTDWNSKIEKNNLLLKNSNNIFKEQVDVATDKITLQPDILLKKKIREQRQLISSLKKENALYKKQLEARPKQSKRTARPKVAPVEPKTQPVAAESKSGFLKSFRNYVTKWKK